MRKFVLGLAGIVLSVNVFAADLKVGDSMPVKGKSEYTWALRHWEDKKGTVKGPVLLFDIDGDFRSDWEQMYFFCKKGEIDWSFPFAIYDFIREKIYLDNNIIKSRNGEYSDGYIDEILDMVNEGNREISDHRPICRGWA